MILSDHLSGLVPVRGLPVSLAFQCILLNNYVSLCRAFLLVIVAVVFDHIIIQSCLGIAHFHPKEIVYHSVTLP